LPAAVNKFFVRFFKLVNYKQNRIIKILNHTVMGKSEKELTIGRRNALKMIGLSSAAMLSAGFSDILAAEPADMKAPAKALNK
jgi:hypothetical protein